MLLLLAAVAVLALALSPVVQAQNGGGKGPVDAGGAPEDVDTVPGFEPDAVAEAFAGACGDFPVLVELDGKIKTIELPNGTTLYTGPGLNATITNLETGTSETFSITGQFRVLPLDEEGIQVTEATGRNLLTDPEAGFVIASGNFSFAFNPETGELVQPLSGEGQLIDVCEALA
jgi:hypothetical protein